MTLYKPQQSKYWYTRFVLKGRIYVKSTRQTSKVLAREFEVQYKKKVYESVVLGKRESIELEEALQRYLTTMVDTKSERLVRRHIPIIVKHCGNILLDELQDKHVHRLVFELRSQLTDATIHLYLSTLRACFKTPWSWRRWG